MNWEAIGAVGEILGATGVIVTLLYLAVQIRNQSRQTTATTIHAASTSNMLMTAEFLRYVDTWQKVVTGAPFEDETEERKGILLFNLVMVENQDLYHQFQTGYLDAGSWATRLSNLQPMVRFPIFNSWRESFGGKGPSRPRRLEFRPASSAGTHRAARPGED